MAPRFRDNWWRWSLLLAIFLLCLEFVKYPSYFSCSIRNQSLDDLRNLLDRGHLTSEVLVKTYLSRIAETNPTFHTVIELNQNALEDARQLDQERKEKGARSKLHGIPILVKDSISVKGMDNTAGSFCLAGSRAKKESSVITRLRAAGAIFLGKANMSEWGNGRSSLKTASNGWSALGNQTYGIYHPRQDPCGSSSGSAVAVALGLAAGAVGVETVGSITCPAMRSNLVSIKTTSGLVARDHIIVPQIRGSVGPMAHTVKDAAIMLSIMAGPTEDDPLSMEIPFETIPEYENSCKKDALDGSRLAIPRNALLNPIAKDMNVAPVIDVFEAVIERLTKAGAIVIDQANYTAYDEVNAKNAPQGIAGPAEWKHGMISYFRDLEVNPRNLQTMEDLISCTKETPEEEYPSRDVDFWDSVKNAEDIQSPRVIEAFQKMTYLGGTGGINGVLDNANADAIIYPSICSSDVPGLVGYPVICVPLGFMPKETPVETNPRGNLIEDGPGIPFGLSFIGRPFSEQRLIELAYSFEQLTKFASEGRPLSLPKHDLVDTLGVPWIFRRMLPSFEL